MNSKKLKSLDHLEIGIKQLLRENRCSYSDAEIVMLKDCLILIQQARADQDLSIIAKILTILGKLLSAASQLTDLF